MDGHGMKLKRPILIGGLGLSAGLWLLNSLQQPFANWDGSFMLSAIALGSGVWWLRRLRPAASDEPVVSYSPVTAEDIEQAVQAVEARIQALQTEVQNAPPRSKASKQINADSIQAFEQQLQTFQNGLERSELQVTLVGSVNTGKTSLKQKLAESVSPISTTSSTSSITWADATLESNEDAHYLENPTLQTSDLTLFVLDGDLAESDLQQIKQLLGQRHRLIVVFNKQDRYSLRDRTQVLQTIQSRLQPWIAAADVVGVAAVPNPIKVRQHQADGQVQEYWEQPEPELGDLQTQIDSALDAPQSLVYGTTWRQMQALQRSVQKQINAVRRDRAMPVIDQYQWISGAAAFTNPLPSLDLLATAAVSTQLIVDLGQIYGQTFTLAQAKAIAGTLASQTVKLGLVELSTQALSTVLKGHAVTFMAGGLLQGLSAAYLTRLAGLSLIEFFEEQSLNPAAAAAVPSVEQITQKLQAIFQQMGQTARLQALVQQGIQKLGARTTSSQTDAAATASTAS
jgi:hypothetical protein